ncbi:MAG: MBL fold metallo-hydrolase [Bacteroidales bacterium]|nr:MBL fold metallo-hydrolase [Bacteroidales bacterium]
MKRIFLLIFFINFMNNHMEAQTDFKTDTLKTKKGDLEITFIGHGTLLFQFDGKIIHVDPFSKLADYSKLPKADLILITHNHGDHLDLQAINAIIKDSTQIIFTETCKENATELKNALVMKNGDKAEMPGLKIDAVPAYNLIHKRNNGDFYHPKGVGNGYILTIGSKKIYIAGDTENIPEMKKLKKIDIAFLPMNLPYTMTPEMVADAAKAFKPKILYPYHFGETDTNKLVELLQDEKSVEIRIRNMK